MNRGARFGIGFLGGAVGTGVGAFIVRMVKESERRKRLSALVSSVPSVAVPGLPGPPRFNNEGGIVPQQPSGGALAGDVTVDRQIDAVNAADRNDLLDLGLPALIGGLAAGTAAAIPE